MVRLFYVGIKLEGAQLRFVDHFYVNQAWKGGGIQASVKNYK
jgi:hypothetical protein